MKKPNNVAFTFQANNNNTNTGTNTTANNSPFLQKEEIIKAPPFVIPKPQYANHSSTLLERMLS